ncbi:MAG: class I SAM-dependent rRNA methyltransferase [Bryobacteraceae bacterium]|nr:class I SAM-dependent rRNA methyltransferase [Bryobacteraceae bacterium]
MIEVRVNRKAQGRVASGHPWIYSSDVVERGEAQPGDVVKVMDPGGRALGVAHYSASSQITLRMLSERVEPVDGDFIRERIEAAEMFRRLALPGADCFRLVFGEADFLPGLVIDRYANCFAMQTLNQGMDRISGLITGILDELYQPAVIVARNTASARSREQLPLETKVLKGEPEPLVWITMNGLRLAVDLIGGQKTGIFLDQRENYAAAARWAHGRALDCFTCTGGFALHMAGRCQRVEAVDTSAPALAIAEENRKANGVVNVEFREANAFDLLAGHAAAGRHFDTIVLDPPAFAKSRANIAAALRGYKEINLRALKLLSPGGVLVTCSCSHHVSEAALLELLAEASLDAGRRVRVLERRTQAPDHPILLTVPETCYLKCLIVQVI